MPDEGDLRMLDKIQTMQGEGWPVVSTVSSIGHFIILLSRVNLK